MSLPAPGRRPPFARLLRNARNARDWLLWAWAHRKPSARLRALREFEARHATAPAIRVDVEAGEEARARLVARIEESWRAFGESEPHWSVLTDPAYRAERIGETARAFYRSGEAEIDRVRRDFARAGADFAALSRVLDYGCGVGRVSAAFARAGKAVIGVDVSEPHLALARKACEGVGPGRAEFRRLTRLAEIDDLPQVDLLFSVIVLQHNPPPVIAEILSRALARVAPGGYAWFQLPTYMEGYGYDLTADLDAAPGEMEFHLLPQATVFRLLDQAGFVPLEVRPSPVGFQPEVASHIFLARRRPDGRHDACPAPGEGAISHATDAAAPRQRRGDEDG